MPLLFKNHNNEKLITTGKAITPTASTPAPRLNFACDTTTAINTLKTVTKLTAAIYRGELFRVGGGCGGTEALAPGGLDGTAKGQDFPRAPNGNS